MQRSLFSSACFAVWTTLALSWLPAGSSAQDSGRQEATAASPYWADAWRGWHFYEEPEPEGEDAASPRRPVPPPATPSAKTPPPKPPELVQFQRLQKTLEEYRNVAIMRPTEANVRRYMELEAKVVARASYFADVAQRVAWATPELDPTLQGRPVNAKALEVFERQQISDRSSSIGALGQDHVLFFFFRGDCPYCHAFAPTLAAFQERHGIKVVGISVDGGSMPGFPDARSDNGIARTLQVTQVPAVFLAQPFTGKITPIGFGVLSEAELLERITTVSAPSAEEMLPSTSRHVVLQ
ncbi:MAG: conjugal transfer protein TraF [Rubrivivax sp.]|nr:conjugal transfer protein TraF [Rubrivivax sp.]